MHAIASRAGQREKTGQARARAIVRFNGLLFHSLAAASFMETAAPLHGSRLSQVYAAHPEVRLWFEQAWGPRRAALGRRLRDFIEATWPEFDWSTAYEEFYESCRRRQDPAGRGAALDALGLCVACAQAAVFYRALARGADDPALRALARQAAQEYGSDFDCFRALFERCKRDERVGFLASWRALREACRSARDFSARAAFEPLGRHWSGAPTVPGLDYGEFRERLVALIERHAGLGRIERLLFRPWLARERPVPVPQVPERRPERRLSLAPRLAAA